MLFIFMDARKNDSFLARNCEKCEKGYVPIFGQIVAGFCPKLNNIQSKATLNSIGKQQTMKYSYILNFQSFPPLPIVLLQNSFQS